MKKLCILLVGSLAAASIADARPDRLSRILVKQASDADAAAGTNDDVFPSVAQVAYMIGTLGDGTAFLSGDGPPSSGTGADGDHYLDRVEGDLYLKVSGNWGLPVSNLRGPIGLKGDPGDPGAPGAPGEDSTVPGPAGADGKTTWYLESGTPSDLTGVDGDFLWRGADGCLFMKTAGAWGAPVFSLANIGLMNIETINLTNPLPGTKVSIDASGFNGNLTTSDTTVQAVAQKLDDLITSGSGIANVVEDLTPQLGGTLDLNGQNILAGAVTLSPAELAYLDGLTDTVANLLAAKAPLASPTFTGTPAAPTAAAGTNTTQLATTEFAQTAANIGVINAQTGTTYTFVLADGSPVSKTVTFDNAAAITATIPPNASVAYPVGTQLTLWQLGAGQVTIAPGSGVTLSARGGALKIAGQYGCAYAIKIATDTWLITGDLST